MKVSWKIPSTVAEWEQMSWIEEQRSESFECSARLSAQALAQPTAIPRVKVPLRGAGGTFIGTFHPLPCYRRRSDCGWPTLCLLSLWTCPVSTSENRTIRRPPQGPVSHPDKPQRYTPGGVGRRVRAAFGAKQRFKWWTKQSRCSDV